MNNKKLELKRIYIFGWKGTFGKYHEGTGVLTNINGRKLVFDDNLHLDYLYNIKWIESTGKKGSSLNIIEIPKNTLNKSFQHRRRKQ